MELLIGQGADRTKRDPEDCTCFWRPFRGPKTIADWGEATHPGIVFFNDERILSLLG